VPSDTPTREPTKSPTGEPTSELSDMPTRTPTAFPTAVASGNPTSEPIEEPTGEPTVKLTDAPTETPTAPSTDTTSKTPSVNPLVTPNPSMKPTPSFPLPNPEPSSKPIPSTEAPTIFPTVKDIDVTPTPTDGLSELEPTEVAVVMYGIAVTDGKIEDVPFSSYESDLIQSMDIVAENVAADINLVLNDYDNRLLNENQQVGTTLRRSLQRSHRKLSSTISVKLPTEIDDIIDAECPSFVPPNDSCETVTASVDMNIAMTDNIAATVRQDSSKNLFDATAVKELFQENLNTAIESGALQAALMEVNPDSVVSITTGAAPSPPGPTPTLTPTLGDDTLAPTPTITAGTSNNKGVPLSSGGIAGLILAGLGGLIIGFLCITALRRRESEDDENSSANVQVASANVITHDIEEAQAKKDDAASAASIDLGSDDGDGEFNKTERLDEPSQPPAITDSGPPLLDTGAIVATAAIGTAVVLVSEHGNDQNNLSTNVGSPGKKKKPSGTLYEVPGAKGMISDEASSAGESGWSSNQDGSSANTSMDASLDSIPQSNFAGISPVVLGEVATVGVDAGNVDNTSSLPASPERLQQEEQVNSISHSLSPMHSTSPATSRGSQAHSQEQSYTGTSGTDGSKESTYSELDEAIQKGDWAAVGVTAALLASQAYGDESTTGSSKKSNIMFRRQSAPLNPERAAELDRLVESGDWEGVVAAAAKFDAQEALRGDAQSQNSSGSVVSVPSTAGSHHSSALSGPGSVGGSSNGTIPSNMSGSQTIDTTTSPSTYTATGLTATSDTASTRSKARKLSEIRDEVEALVNAVVPEEAENVDEMMTQFRGREEELVETLRSMQERQVALKARKESRKQAKLQVKQYVQDKKKQEPLDSADVAVTSAEELWMKEIEDGDSGGAEPATPTKVEEDAEANAMKNQLKEAIDNEDWENVAEAAAGLSGHAFKTPQTPQDNVSDTSNRSMDLNALVDAGDWDGVVAAASKYAEGSTTIGGSSNENTKTSSEEIADDSTIEMRRRRREERLKEEEEALAQAQIWDAIADQTKVEDSKAEEGAAGLAADWAIDQSLAALRKAEEDDENDSIDSGKQQKDGDESL